LGLKGLVVVVVVIDTGITVTKRENSFLGLIKNARSFLAPPKIELSYPDQNQFSVPFIALLLVLALKSIKSSVKRSFYY
jgi:hypothetical protein